MHPVATNPKRLLVAVAVGAFALSGGSGAIGIGEAFAGSSGSATIHFSNASARSNACKASNVEAIFITVSEVDGHRSGKGGGWSTLAKPSTPVQLDLLNEGQAEPEPPPDANDCMLASMGSDGGLPAGKYQQLRVMVDTDNANPPANNACASVGTLNCVVTLENGVDVVHPLTVPSGSQSGIKIPSTKIHKGGLVIAAGQGVDLDIDIDGCRSIMVTGGGHGKRKKPPHGGGGASYKLKPVLQAGEVSLNSLISGQVVVGTNNGGTVSAGGTPVSGADVWLEDVTNADSFTEGDPTPTATNVAVNRVLATTSTDPNGNFVFCPVPSTTHKLELVASSATMPVGQGQTSNPSDVTITTGVTSGPNGGMSGLVIPLVEPSSAPTTTAEYTTESNTNAAISETLDLGMTQSDGTNAAPFANSSLGPTTTASSNNGCAAACPAKTDCSCVTTNIPADNPVIGPAGTGSGYSQSGTAEFSLIAEGSAASGAGSCSPNQMTTASGSTQATPPNPALSFQGCQ